ncbi:MAG: ABC transporter permease [Acidobacteria bacterium]|nr:ABC transporter permease [Acidobacteriota bacterium]MCA1632391.1 ABC transporter permease [Acidobacteriota bacterium]MCA1640733.1 ABC transporter permease [Acidobacteriota bacterium]
MRPPANPPGERGATVRESRALNTLARLRRRGGDLARRRAGLVAGLAIITIFYLAAALADFVAPYDYRQQSRAETFAPPTPLHFFDPAGDFHARPFVRPRRISDPVTRAYVEDETRRYPLTLFARGYTYKFLGLFTTDRHLFGVAAERGAGEKNGAGENSDQQSSQTSQPAPRLHLLGTDRLGRDRFSQLLVAARFSLSVAPVGTILAAALGVLVGCLAGYAGRKTDAVLMRAADAMMALPELVLILAARAALPLELPTARAAAFLVVIFVAVGWAEMARLVRGLVLELREREYVTAARALGMRESRVLFRHVLPNAARAILVQLSLMLPAFLLAETALSYLGVGVQEPEVSWGTMLAEASDLSRLREQPLVLLSPAAAIFLFVLGVRLLTNGLRRGRDA